MYSKSDTLGSIKNRLKPERTVKNPFAMQWLDSCYQETLLPDKPWEKVRDKVALQFTEKIRKQEEHPERFQMILRLLGTEFKVKYFPEVDYKPFLLESPNMHKEQREKLQSEAQSWMNNQLNRAAKEVDCNRVLPGTEPSAEICPEMLIFMQNAYNTFQTGLDRHLYQMEMRILRNKDVEEQEQTKQVKEQHNVERVQVRAYGPGTASTTSSATIRQRLSTAGFDVKIGKMPGEAPTFTSPQTEEVGESVKAVLMRDPRRFVDIARRLHGRQMPVSLRSYMWLEVLFKVNRERLPESNVEKAVRERFGRAVHKGMSDLKIKRATMSPISGLIEKAVKEVYNQTLSMQGYNNQYHVKDTCRALNVLYTYDRSYEPYLIHWLFPLEVAFKEQSDAGEHVYELAMYLDLLNEHCFPSWPQIYAMAERTMSRLEAVDYELYNHIKTVAQKDVIFNPKEFMVYLLHAEKQKATQGSETERSRNVAESMSTDLLTDPVVFLRKWMGEGFVSVLDTGAVLFIWDQCFLQMWQGPAMENLSLVLLLLLRHKFMSVTDYRSMKEVFFNAPCKLYTADIQRAWIFVERGGDPADVPFMSRQRPVTPPPSPPPTVVPEPRVDVLPAIALKNVNLILNVSATSATKNPWLSQIDPTRLKVLCTVFYGRVKLASKLTHNWALIVSSDDQPDGNRSFHLKLDKEDDFVFENFDVGLFEVEREQDAYPYALLRIDYILDFDFDQQKLSPRVRPPITLGWAKIPLFQKHKPDLVKQEEPQDVGGDTEKKDEGKQKGKNAKKRKSVKPGTENNGKNKPVESVETHEDEKAESAQNLVITDDIDAPWVSITGDKRYPIYSDDVPEISDVSSRNTPTPREPTQEDLITAGSEINLVVYEPHDNLEPVKPLTPVLETEPGPESQPQSEQDAEPLPPPTATPDNDYWTRFKPEVARKIDSAELYDSSHTFDICIDYVRFLPDNASIVKVTGRILRPGEVQNIPDIAAYPDVNSSPRLPEFRYRMVVNETRKQMDVTGLLLLRVYTVQLDTLELVVVGSCLISLFNKQGKLRVGGFQCALHPAMPDLKKGIDGVKETDLDTVSRVPAVSMCVRLLPHAPAHVAAPSYNSGYYRSESCKPSKTEYRIMNAFMSDRSPRYADTIIEMVKKVKKLEKDESETNANIAMGFQKRRLDQRRHLPLLTPAHHLYPNHYVRYRSHVGLKVQIKQAFGFPETQHVYCFGQIITKTKPAATKTPARASLKHDSEEPRILAYKLDPNSSMKSPKYRDDHVVIHPDYDSRSFVLVKVYLVDGVYKPWRDNSVAGSVHPRSGSGQLTIDKDITRGWAVVPLFDWEATAGGEHIVPLFKGEIPPSVLEQLKTESVDHVLGHATWTNENKFDSSGLVVHLKDCHFIDSTPYDENKRYLGLLDAVGDRTKYTLSLEDSTGKKVNEVLAAMIKVKDETILTKERDLDLLTKKN